MTPTEAIVAFWKNFWWLCIMAAIAVGVFVGGWQGGWWLQQSAATHEYQIQQNGVNNQDTTRANITRWFGNLTQDNVQIAEAKAATPVNISLVGQLKVEAAAQADQICQAAEGLSGVPLPTDQQQFLNQNCQDGVVISTSPYFIPGAI